MSFRTQDFQCTSCGFEEEVFLDFRGMTEEQKKGEFENRLCPQCGAKMETVWRPGHGGRVSREGSDESIAKMKKSFKQRFVKKDIDDVRHKHGKLFDEGLRTAAADRIKKEET